MRWYFHKRAEIISGTITAILAVIFMLIAGFLSHIGYNVEVLMDDYLFSSKVPLKGLTSVVAQNASPKESALRETTGIDSSQVKSSPEVRVDYYIIVGSFKNHIQAQKNADKLTHHFNTNIIILPVTKEGIYRICCGKYPTLDKAKDTIKSIRTKINPDAWIFAVKEELTTELHGVNAE